MKTQKTSVIIIIALCLLFAQAPQAVAVPFDECNECFGFGTPGTGDPNGPGCLTGLEKDFFTTGRQDPTNWDLAIWEIVLPSGEVVRIQSEYAWVNGQAVDFSVSYRPSDGLVTYIVGTTTLTFNYAAGKAFGYVIPFAKGDGAGNNVELTELSLQTTSIRSICDIITQNDLRGVEVAMTDNEQMNGFTISGKVKLIWNPSGHPQERPAFHIFLMNTHEPTAITLSSFTAKASNGRVKLEWVTEAEVENVGFNIYRAEAVNGNYIQINDELIASKGSPTKGAKYVFTDNIAKNRKTYFYKLEDVDIAGVSTFSEPISAMPRFMLGIFNK